jgi:ABC-type transporter Mla maintaining outer membrane lipid asymmetry ATPase subunit MlaF
MPQTAVDQILELRGVRKDYGGLRPLRVQSLVLARGERVAVSGFDAVAAEVLVNLVTGAAVPDSGEVRVLGRPTADIVNGDEWLASLDRFGIVSARAVLLDGTTLAQNLAMPFTLDIDPLSPEMRARVEDLAVECGLGREWLDTRTGEIPPLDRARAHLARAVALAPQLLVLEHPTAAVPASDVRAYAADVVRVCEIRRLTVLAITEDTGFAGTVASRNLALQPATGELAVKRKGWWRT